MPFLAHFADSSSRLIIDVVSFCYYCEMLLCATVFVELRARFHFGDTCSIFGAPEFHPFLIFVPFSVIREKYTEKNFQAKS